MTRSDFGRVLLGALGIGFQQGIGQGQVQGQVKNQDETQVLTNTEFSYLVEALNTLAIRTSLELASTLTGRTSPTLTNPLGKSSPEWIVYYEDRLREIKALTDKLTLYFYKDYKLEAPSRSASDARVFTVNKRRAQRAVAPRSV